MERTLRRRISKIEKGLPGVLEKRRKRREQVDLNYRRIALTHATAVAALVLAGKPKVDEPLIRAWARALDYYEGSRAQELIREMEKSNRKIRAITAELGFNWTITDLRSCPDEITDDEPHPPNATADEDIERANKLLKKSIGESVKDYADATKRMHSAIVGSAEDQAATFTEVFKSAPVWLLKFTRTFLDAQLLKFDLPDLSGTTHWGQAGLRDARRWPLLPVGVMSEGDPIPPSESDVSTEPSLEELLSALEITNRPPWELTRREHLEIQALGERLSGRDLDVALTAKIAWYERMDELYSKIHVSA